VEPPGIPGLKALQSELELLLDMAPTHEVHLIDEFFADDDFVREADTKDHHDFFHVIDEGSEASSQSSSNGHAQKKKKMKTKSKDDTDEEKETKKVPPKKVSVEHSGLKTWYATNPQRN
jgi:hypothetical protein